MNIDIHRARAETPGVNHCTHFNNCGASLPPQCVMDAVNEHLHLEAIIGGYEAAHRAQDKLEHTYDAIAKLINGSREEVAFIENATRAWDMAFYSFDFQPGDCIITAMAEYASNYIAYLQVAKKRGLVIKVIPNDEFGQLDVNTLEHLIDENVKLISVVHVPTNGGLVNPAKEIGVIAKANNIPFLLDTCQSVGQMPVDVDELNADIIIGTGRKYLRGPRGTGFLYVRDSLIEQLEPPFLDLQAATWTERDQFEIRKDARRFETWERHVAGQIGLGVAVDYALDWGLEHIYERIRVLADTMRQQLSTLPGITVRDLGRKQCGIVSFTSDRKTPEEIQTGLSRRNINASLSQAPSTLLDMRQRELDTVIRAGVHYYNSEEEVLTLVGAVEEILKEDG